MKTFSPLSLGGREGGEGRGGEGCFCVCACVCVTKQVAARLSAGRAGEGRDGRQVNNKKVLGPGRGVVPIF